MSDTTKQTYLVIGSGGAGGSAVLEEDVTAYGVGELGGITEGDTDLAGTTFTQAWKHLVQKIIHPTYLAPKITNVKLAYPGGQQTCVEINTQSNITITTEYSQNDAGAVTGYKLYRGDVLLVEDTSIVSFTDDYIPTTSASYKYRTEVSYADGSVKKNNIGLDDPIGQILAGTVSGNSFNIPVVYPTFYGVMDAEPSSYDEVAALTKLVRTKGNVSLAYTTGGIKTVVFASPWKLKSIINQNNYEVISAFNKQEMTYSDGATCYVYSLVGVNITDFTYTFKY